MKTFKDVTTGKKFQLGKRGLEALTQRVLKYAEERRAAGVSEVALHPTTIPTGAKFACDTCEEVFEFDGEDQEAFIENIKTHGRTHGMCKILPVI